MTDTILTHCEDRILKITINRPDKKNALTLAMYDQMTAAVEAAQNDSEVRVVTITGTGDAFSSGNDLADFLSHPPTPGDSPAARFLHTIAGAEKPLIAAVNGLAIGIGTTLLLHCDLAYAAVSAKFQLPFVNLALVPEAGSSLLLPQVAGHKKAAELLMLGEMFDPETAREAGLINGVCADVALEQTVMEVSRRLAAKPPEALRLTKALLKDHSGDAGERINKELGHFAHRLESPEAHEAMQAFMEKRLPDFSKFS
ncbi:enoyl-CoA hydratase [Pelagibius sp. Alg239-R121]|uniref:enoyl-CoA hydratase n=1 Tax=Pelagibius sp. Alg239-R121 TaxID=2993448 RepID=UPI0024A75429|nr:enoyl-CoA hydratase [Pelagibius sp. Alg239-R121]